MRRLGALWTMASIAVLAACSGRFEGVDDGASATSDDGGSEASTGCSAIQGCGPSPFDSGVTPTPQPTGSPTTPPSGNPTPSPPPPSDASAPPPQNPPGCPSQPPVPGDICKDKGLACTWVNHGCDTTACTCAALGNGPASWQCSGTYTCLDGGH